MEWPCGGRRGKAQRKGGSGSGRSTGKASSRPPALSASAKNKGLSCPDGQTQVSLSSYRVKRKGVTSGCLQSTTSIAKLLWPLMTKGVEGNSYS